MTTNIPLGKIVIKISIDSAEYCANMEELKYLISMLSILAHFAKCEKSLLRS